MSTHSSYSDCPYCKLKTCSAVTALLQLQPHCPSQHRSRGLRRCSFLHLLSLLLLRHLLSTCCCLMLSRLAAYHTNVNMRMVSDPLWVRSVQWVAADQLHLDTILHRDSIDVIATLTTLVTRIRTKVDSEVAEIRVGLCHPDDGGHPEPSPCHRPPDSKTPSAMAVSVEAFNHTHCCHFSGSRSIRVVVLVLDHTNLVCRGQWDQLQGTNTGLPSPLSPCVPQACCVYVSLHCEQFASSRDKQSCLRMLAYLVNQVLSVCFHDFLHLGNCTPTATLP